MSGERIVLLGDYPPPYGGVAVHVQALQRVLQREGFSVTVLDIGKGGVHAPGVIAVKGGIALMQRLVRFASQGYRLHFHTSGNNPKAWRVAGLAGAVWAGRTQRPLITVHSGLFPGFVDDALASRALVRAVLPFYGKVLGVSAEVSRALAETGASPGQLGTMPGFIWNADVASSPPPAFSEARARFRPLLSIAHHPSPIYGRRLLNAAVALLREALPRAGVVAFGPGLEGEATEGICALGELPRAEALAVMRDSDVFVRPTYADGDALSVREALALGVRCVASDAAERPAGVTTFRTGDAADLSRALQAALSDLPERTLRFDAGPLLVELYRELAAAERGDAGAAQSEASHAADE